MYFLYNYQSYHYQSDTKTGIFFLSEYIHIYYFILFYIRRAILTPKNRKKGLIQKKNFPYTNYWCNQHLQNLLLHSRPTFRSIKLTTKTCQRSHTPHTTPHHSQASPGYEPCEHLLPSITNSAKKRRPCPPPLCQHKRP
jgi:hypothetical protein